MTIDLLKDKGTPVGKQPFTWKELVRPPYSKLDDDAFTRVRVILMNGPEAEALRFAHVCGRLRRELQPDLARLRRAEQGQQTMVNTEETLLEKLLLTQAMEAYNYYSCKHLANVRTWLAAAQNREPAS
jgi:hypothetical protein